MNSLQELKTKRTRDSQNYSKSAIAFDTLLNLVRPKMCDVRNEKRDTKLRELITE